MKFYGDKGHNPKVVEKFNRIAKRFDVTELPDLLESWMDDTDIHDFATHLEERFYSNFNEYVIEYNIRSLCGEEDHTQITILITKELE